MKNIVYENNLQPFTVVRGCGNQAQYKCQPYNDEQKSLTLSQDNKCVLTHCHAGCALEGILSVAEVNQAHRKLGVGGYQGQ